jgi:predicted unusual protein kinase regulating ubiquinone biosynthesis (AarF/ABC1/UbiB family)
MKLSLENPFDHVVDDNDSENRLSSRIKRYGQVSAQIGALAARFVGKKYLGLDTDQDKHAQKLKEVLGQLKGPLVKIAQFLATIPGGVPPAYAKTFLELQNQAPPMGWALVRRRMQKELGEGWATHFATFDRESVASASLGQVHRAKSLDGENLACKLQYPDVTSAVYADLNQLKWVLSLYQQWSHALDTTQVQKEIESHLKQELDYVNEAFNNRIYANFFDGHPDIHVPKIYPSLCTKRLLVMEWMDGKHLFQFVDHSQEDRDRLGGLLFNSWYAPLYQMGVLHGDPHPGNYTVTDDLKLNLLDFGCIRFFPSHFIRGVIDLYRALQNNDRDGMVHAYETWGFKNLSNEIIEVMTMWAKILYDPLLDDRKRLIQEESFFEGKGWEIVRSVHQSLEKAGRIQPPKEFVLMDRAAVGIGSVLMKLKSRQNWCQHFEKLIESFTENDLQNTQNRIIRDSRAYLEKNLKTPLESLPILDDNLER